MRDRAILSDKRLWLHCVLRLMNTEDAPSKAAGRGSKARSFLEVWARDSPGHRHHNQQQQQQHPRLFDPPLVAAPCQIVLSHRAAASLLYSSPHHRPLPPPPIASSYEAQDFLTICKDLVLLHQMRARLQRSHLLGSRRLMISRLTTQPYPVMCTVERKHGSSR